MFTEQEETLRALRGWEFNRDQHGSLYDRGMSDSYYHRAPVPHYGGVGGESGPRITVMYPAAIKEYMAGYDYNERMGYKKSWD